MSVHSFVIARTAHLDGAKIVVANHETVRVLYASGAIDTTNAQQWQAKLTFLFTTVPAGTIGVVLDLTTLDVLSAAGLRGLLAASATVPTRIRLVVVARNMTLHLLSIVDSAHHPEMASNLGLALAMIADG